MEGVWRIDEASETPDTEPAVAPAADIARDTGNATLTERGLLVREAVRVCDGGGSTKRSATDPGGERGNEVRNGRLPGELVSESLCWLRRSVGVNSGPSS
jgi:hypothetical protein